MSVPPAFGDIGKEAGDLFKKGYNYGQFKLEASSQAKSGCEFKVVTTSEGSRISGSLEAKQRMSKYGLTYTGKWNTENAFNLNLAVEDQFVEGLKLTLDSTITPHTGKKSQKGKFTYKRPHFNGTGTVSMDGSGTVISCEDSFSYDKFVGGVNAAYNVSTGQLGSHSILLGYKTADFAATAGVANFARDRGTEISASLFHRTSKQLHAGAQISHKLGADSKSSLEVATKYTPDAASTVQAKVNCCGNLGLSYAFALNKGMKLTLSAMVDAMHLDQPNHRLGFAVDLCGK